MTTTPGTRSRTGEPESEGWTPRPATDVWTDVGVLFSDELRVDDTVSPPCNHSGAGREGRGGPVETTRDGTARSWSETTAVDPTPKFKVGGLPLRV